MTFDDLEQKYRRIIRAIAVKLGHRFPGVLPDLEQEGRIALWKLNLTTVTTNEDSYIRNAIRNRMIDYLRREHLRNLWSLDWLLKHGWELEREGDRVVLVYTPAHERASRRIYEADEQLYTDMELRHVLRTVEPEQAKLLRQCFGLTPMPEPSVDRWGRINHTLSDIGRSLSVSEATVRYRRDQLLHRIKEVLGDDRA